MRRTVFTLAVAALALLATSHAASAACSLGTCAAGSILFQSAVTRCCDIVISTNPYTAPYTTIGGCDFEGTPTNSAPDGVCVLCNVAGQNATITGSNAIGEVICANDGNDTVDGRGGNDVIMGGAGNDQLTGGSDNDEIHAEGGFDVVLGGSGNDTISDTSSAGDTTYIEGGTGNDFIWTFASDDQIYGEAGDDTIITGSGADWVEGGTGDDGLASLVIGNFVAVDDVLNATFCGGDDDDAIYARGAAHACVDGGSGTDYCDWAFWVSRTQTGFDLGTDMNCETSSGFSAREKNCGCPD